MLDVVIYFSACVAAGAGFAFVYVPLSATVRRWLGRDAQNGSNGRSADKPSGAQVLSLERARQLLAELHAVTTGVAGDVQEHTLRLESINTELLGLSGSPARDGEKLDRAIVRLVSDIVDANIHLKQQLNERAHVIEDQARQLQLQLADPLTGIPNRGAFDGELKRRHSEWSRMHNPFSLILLDVDHFKKFNDGFGHQAGDAVLRGVAQVFSESVREMDLAARYGGEEFVAILPSTCIQDACSAAERVRHAIEQATFDFDDREFQVTVSVGAAQVRRGDEPDQIVRRADQALYAAKHAGRNRAFYHDGDKCLPITGVRDLRVEPAPEPPASPPPQPPVSETEPTGELSIEPLDVNPSEDGVRCDVLTGLPNRSAFEEDVRRRLAEWRRSNRPLSLAVLSLDNFENIKKRHGPSAMSLILTTTRQFLCAALREMDTIARFSDREFAILLPACNLSGAISVAERVRHAIAKCDLLKHNGAVLRFTVSAGTVEAQTSDDSRSIIDRLESAVRTAEATGGNRTFQHDGETSSLAESPRKHIFKQLVQDLERDTCELQPK